MPQVAEVRCADDSLSLLLAPGSTPDRVAGEFQIGAVVSGGTEWACHPRESVGPASPVARRVMVVPGTDMMSFVNQVASPLITVQKPFEAFEYEDIDIWSMPDVASSSRRSPRLAATEISTGGTSIRLNPLTATVSHLHRSRRTTSSSF